MHVHRAARCIARCVVGAGIDFLRSRDQTHWRDLFSQYHRMFISAVVRQQLPEGGMAELFCAVCWWFIGATKDAMYDDWDRGGHSSGKVHKNGVEYCTRGNFPRILTF